eukprot:10662844-Alexandrium_andersonii.AAC.1
MRGPRPAGTSRAAGATASGSPPTSAGTSGSTTRTTCVPGRTRTCPCWTAWSGLPRWPSSTPCACTG